MTGRCEYFHPQHGRWFLGSPARHYIHHNSAHKDLETSRLRRSSVLLSSKPLEHNGTILFRISQSVFVGLLISSQHSITSPCFLLSSSAAKPAYSYIHQKINETVLSTIKKSFKLYDFAAHSALLSNNCKQPQV
jgi:hypothetical protein